MGTATVGVNPPPAQCYSPQQMNLARMDHGRSMLPATTPTFVRCDSALSEGRCFLDGPPLVGTFSKTMALQRENAMSWLVDGVSVHEWSLPIC